MESCPITAALRHTSVKQIAYPTPLYRVWKSGAFANPARSFYTKVKKNATK
ncbi:hypothetical protein HMPREF9554_01519 [Treponema phagedenis F0421]|nr:hypothetical protein HMPREF9554_01519 [Treponema phagedenis F0421]